MPGPNGPVDRPADAPLLVGGVGLPWLQDAAFAKEFVERVEGLEWPDHVVVEDLSFPAHRVLDRLREVAPGRVVLIVSMLSDIDPPGTVRRYLLEPTPPPVEEVHQRLVESVSLDIVDVEHTLAVVRHWQGLTQRTVVIEVAPPEVPAGLRFGSDVEAVVGKVLGLVHEEVVTRATG